MPYSGSTPWRYGDSNACRKLSPAHAVQRSERSDAGVSRFLTLLGLRQARTSFSHGLSFQGYLVGVVYQAIQDGVGQGRIADCVMPVVWGR
jgi:hypothetical protein